MDARNNSVDTEMNTTDGSSCKEEMKERLIKGMNLNDPTSLST